MKTAVMFERREREKKLQNDTSGYNNAFIMLNQFNQMKKIAANQSFLNKGNMNMSVEIVCDIVDELRRDRKIKLSIRSANYVNEYITVDLN